MQGAMPMTRFSRTISHLQCAALAVLLIVSPASVLVSTAQSYPNRPITMIVPLAAGGGADITARIVADRMKTTLGQPVVVENVPTAAGTVGLSRLAQAVPDGHTIGIGDQTAFVISSVTNPVRYDVLKDFEPIALLSTSPAALIGRNALPPANVRELISWLRANGEQATFAAFGRGSGPHIISVAFQDLIGTH